VKIARLKTYGSTIKCNNCYNAAALIQFALREYSLNGGEGLSAPDSAQSGKNYSALNKTLQIIRNELPDKRRRAPVFKYS
jgi:hypothetical protein